MNWPIKYMALCQVKYSIYYHYLTGTFCPKTCIKNTAMTLGFGTLVPLFFFNSNSLSTVAHLTTNLVWICHSDTDYRYINSQNQQCRSWTTTLSMLQTLLFIVVYLVELCKDLSWWLTVFGHFCLMQNTLSIGVNLAICRSDAECWDSGAKYGTQGI